MLNETLRKQVIAYLNGKMIMDCPLFDDFSGEFISEVIFILKRKTFSIDDHVFDEYNEGNKMYFITKGIVILWHSKSHTFIKEIHEGTVFGEGAFFSKNKRICSARSTTFTEVLHLKREEFNVVCSHYPNEKEIVANCLNCKL